MAAHGICDIEDRLTIFARAADALH